MGRSPAMRPEGYDGFLEDLKQRIRTAQVRAVLAVNRELILLYWQIGREILERQDRAGWGAKIIESLPRLGRTSHSSNRLLDKFPGGIISGFSTW